jgi:hypothetical protein
MTAVNIKLYDIFRKDLHLPDAKAGELVQAIEEAVKEQTTGKHEHTVEIVNKDILSFKNYMDGKLDILQGKMDDKLDILQGKMESKISESKADTIKWMFIFWIGQVVATFGFILLFLKK